MKEYTLEDIAKIKRASVQEIVDYLQVRGVEFTKSLDQPLAPSEIKLIDPILFFKLQHEPKRSRTQDQPKEEEKEDVETSNAEAEIPKGMKLKKASRYFNKPLVVLVEYLALNGLPIASDPSSRLTDEQYDALKRQFGKSQPKKFHFDDILLDSDTDIEYIGIVHFYDGRKNHFGFIGTNDLCPLQSIRFTEDNIKSQNYPTDSAIVSFRYNSRSRVVDAVKTIDRKAHINWKVALRYIGQYADIIGETRNGEPRNISDVLGRLIGLTNGYGLWDILLDLVNTLKDSPDRQEQFINEYLNHPEVFKIVAAETEKEHNGEPQESFLLWQEAIAKIYLTQNDLDHYLLLRDLNPQLPLPFELDDKLRYILFARYGDVTILEGLSDVEKKDANIAESIKALSISEQEARLRLLPNDDFERIVINHMQGSELHHRFIKERWDEEKANMPYLVFDIESDGSNIKEFAYNTEDNYRSYSGEKQLKVLGRRITTAPIVVGHNIRVWDLPILKEKGFETNAFIWDTLEMEILLNPCRYAYSLHTEHNALADTELTNKLFWNQLYRLAKDTALRTELHGFLPPQIDTILAAISNEKFAPLFENEANISTQFFQELVEPSQKLVDQLKEINTISDRSLIIAPKSLWARVAQYIHVAFPKHENNLELMAIDNEAIQSSDLGAMKKCILNRFSKISKTPIVGNLAQYLRVEKISNDLVQLSDSTLSDYTTFTTSNIDCIDIDSFNDPDIIDTRYQHIFIIGSELQDRTHKCQLGPTFSFTDLLSLHSKLPLSMASANYGTIDDAELRKLNIRKPSLTANVWVERLEDGDFAIYHNFEYQVYRKNFLSHFDVKPEYVEWELDESGFNTKNIICYDTDKRATFDSSIYRLTPSTTVRSKYWTYQFALLQKIHVEHSNLPLVYIVNSASEIDAITNYARALGYYIPTEGTAFRKLEYINSHPNGLVIIDKNQFLEGIGNYRTDYALCYVWDNMDVERYQLMWRKLPFENDIVEQDEPIEEHTIGSTPKQCILAEWPIFEHHYSLIAANNRDSKFCILDPLLEDCSEISGVVKCSWKDYSIWDNKEKYIESLEHASLFFKENSISEQQFETDEAMAVLHSTFLEEGQDWYDYQKEILPLILQKQADYIVSIPTGGGKSVLFQGPAIYRAAHSHKLSLVVTPLRALMQDQAETLWERGFYTNVDYLSGDKTIAETRRIYRRIASGEIALLYVTPERFRVRSFVDVLQQRMTMDNGLEYVIYDEAHCVSQWGQDFRPDYRNAVNTCVKLKSMFPFTMAFFSATITAQVENDLRSYVENLQRVGQSPDDYNPIRSHISVGFELCRHEDAARIESIAQFIVEQNIDFQKSRMLVFCRTHQQCEEAATELENIFATRNNRILSLCAGHITYFHAGLDAEQRNEVFEQFKSNGDDRFYILCATKAFGMGMDLPNIHYVVHFNPPSVLEDYLQEVGRAGRDKNLYLDAFPSESPIPALCLASKEDFAHAKDLLIKSLLTWPDLRDARANLIRFIKRFQSIEQTKNRSIVVPYSFWRKNDNISTVDDTTSAKLALYWLEHLGYIKQGYIRPAYLDITLQKRELTEQSTSYWSSSRTIKLSPKASSVFEYISQHIENIDEPTLISIEDLRHKTHSKIVQVFDAIIECQKQGLLSLNDTIQCAVRARRSLETRYMLENDENVFALHIVMEGLRTVLSNCKIGYEKIFSAADIDHICNHLLDDVQFKTVEVVKEKKRGASEKTIYMPWHEMRPLPTGAVTKAETFRKNIITRAGFRIFSIMEYIPGVSCRTEKMNDMVCKIITIKNRDWYSFSTQLEKNCFAWLKYIQNREESFNWTKAVLDLNWDASHDSGYLYFMGILEILRMISYIDFSPLSQSGVEVYTTDTTINKWDKGDATQSPLYEKKKEFEDQDRLKKIRLAAMNVFSVINKNQQGEYIKKYFLCRDYNEFLDLVGEYAPEGSPILSQIKEEALRKEEAKLEGNEAQKSIYEADSSDNINVLAGPGSGKTHVLTLRCAKLIYRESVDPRQILVLAYNRAVVAELRTRLNDLFVRLGMSRVAHQLNVYTFHALAKKTMGSLLDDVSTDMWEDKFNDFLKKQRKAFKELYPSIRYIMIDEFQDITQVRLDVIMKIHALYPNAKFFTIGDINQSIYGFDRVPRSFRGSWGEDISQYAQWLDPHPYYDQLKEKLAPIEKKMFLNYRSYQGILDAAAVFLPSNDRDSMPTSAPSVMEHEPQEQYVFINDNTKPETSQWFNDLPDIIEKAKAENATNDPDRRVRNIAVFFRTNAEVYRGFAKIKNNKRIDSHDIRIRIQGASNCEIWREREVYEIIHYLETTPNRVISLHNNETQNEIRAYIEDLHSRYEKWDTEYLDISYTLILNYLDSIRADFEEHTWGEIAAYIVDVAGRDDGGQVYKIFEQYQSSQLWPDNRLTIVLTTMHKVKGLEFDIVVITPSFADLPMKLKNRYSIKDDNTSRITLPQPNAADLADIEEEKRLLFVAYTRAKKFLHVYKWKRELAIEQEALFLMSSNESLRYTEKEAGMDKYVLSYTAQSRKFDMDDYIRKNVKKDDPIEVKRAERSYDGRHYYVYEIWHQNNAIGQLSLSKEENNPNKYKSNIVEECLKNDVSLLKGLFVSDVCIWTYQETVAGDTNNKNGIQYASRWCDEAKNQGYITLVQIAGFGTR